MDSENGSDGGSDGSAPTKFTEFKERLFAAIREHFFLLQGAISREKNSWFVVNDFVTKDKYGWKYVKAMSVDT